jgi:hypothetical protein
MVRSRPAIAVDLLEADSSTRHFVAMTIRGWELHHNGADPALRQLAADIFARPRRDVLTEQWQFDFGRPAFLRRLPRRVLKRCHYDRLVAVLRDPVTRGLIGKRPKITRRDLNAFRDADRSLIAAASLPAVAAIGAPTIGYILAAIHRHRPDLADGEIKALLRRIGDVKRLGSWLANILEKSSLLPPPWQGTAAITPLRTIAEIRQTGKDVHNCLDEPERWLPVLLGRCYYYRVREPLPPAVIAVAFDNLIGGWRITSYAGERNRTLPPAAKRHIFAEFAAAGIEFFGDDPRRRALNWYGVADEMLLIPEW